MHTYAIVGTVTVSLTVTDTGGLSSTATANGTISPGQPIANAGGPYSGTAGTAISLCGSASTDPQGETLILAWDFGDGSSPGVGAAVSHTYSRPGTFIVSVVATNSSGLSATATTRATMAPAAPRADAGGPYSSIPGKTVSFSGGNSTDPQGELLAFSWTFGDGSAGSGVSPSHIYGRAGAYPVSLTVANTSGLSASVATLANIAAAAPTANAGGPYTFTAGQAVSFNGSGSTDPQNELLTYAWNFGDGSTGIGASPAHTYALAGTYAVALTVTSTSGLTTTVSTKAIIGASSPVDGWVMSGTQPISKSSVQLYAVGTGTSSLATPLLLTPVATDMNGGFSIAGTYHCPTPATQIYLTAMGGNPGLVTGTNNSRISLIAAVGSCSGLTSSLGHITIDEVSTIAAVWPGSAFLSNELSFAAPDPRSLSNAFICSSNLASIARGLPNYAGTILVEQDLMIRSLANSLHSCVSSNGDTSAGSPCGTLFAAVTSGGGRTPADTASSALAIALNPTLRVQAIYDLGTANAAFQPALQAPPVDWTLGLTNPAPSTFSAALNRTTVFMGDSITAWWPLPDNNRGIGGQHSIDMLARFANDVLGHGYARVVILAGTNDIWFPIQGSDQAAQQIETMAQMARAAGIEVVLCELPPMILNQGAYYSLEVSLNGAIADFAMTNGYLLVDYYTPMLDHPEYFNDGVHPNASGYAVMEAALSSVVEQ